MSSQERIPLAAAAVVAAATLAATLPALPARAQAAAPAKPKAAAPASAPAAPAAAKPADAKNDALVAWLEGFFNYGAGEVTADEIAQVKIPGYKLVRVQKKFKADERANDQFYAAVEDAGRSAILGELFVDEERLKAPSPVRTDADLATIRDQVKRYLRGSFKIALEPSMDRPSWKGIKISPDTGYGVYDIGGLLSAHDGAILILGRAWDRRRPIAEQRKEIAKLDATPFQGPADASITVVEYSDMQCGYCRKRTADWEPLLDKLKSQLKLKRYVKSFPLVNDHPWAFRASSAGRCFFERDPATYFRWKSQVYSRQETLTVSDLDTFALDFASASDVPEAAFKGCYLSPRVSQKILADISEGFALRVRSTPTYVIDGAMISWFADDLMEEFLRKTYLKGQGLPLPTRPAAPIVAPAKK